MADEAIDPRIADILSRLIAVETIMHESNGSKEKEGNIENREKDKKHQPKADIADLKSRLAALDDSDGSDSANDSDSAKDSDSAENAS